MCIMEGQGVGGHVGDDFSVFCVNLLPLWSVTQCDFPSSALNVKVVRISNKHVRLGTMTL